MWLYLKRKRFRLLLLCQIILFASIVNGQTHKKKVVFVIADGIPADIMERVAKPNLDIVIRSGAYKRAFVGGQRNL